MVGRGSSSRLSLMVLRAGVLRAVVAVPSSISVDTWKITSMETSLEFESTSSKAFLNHVEDSAVRGKSATQVDEGEGETNEPRE